MRLQRGLYTIGFSADLVADANGCVVVERAVFDVTVGHRGALPPVVPLSVNLPRPVAPPCLTYMLEAAISFVRRRNHPLKVVRLSDIRHQRNGATAVGFESRRYAYRWSVDGTTQLKRFLPATPSERLVEAAGSPHD